MKKTLAIGAMLGIMTASSAMALPFNERTGFITPNLSGEQTVQTSLDQYVNNPSNFTSSDSRYRNAVSSQSNAAIWTPSDGGNVESFLVNLFTAHGSGVFGVYSKTTGDKFDLIDKLANPGATGASFSIVDGDLVHYANGSKVVDVAGFGNSFGFFWKDTVENYVSYTEDTLNPNGQAQSLVYQLANGSKVKTIDSNTPRPMRDGDDWILAFEDHPNGDFDYNDAIFLVQDVAPVPEPGTMMMLGAGFLGLAIYGKRRKNA